MASDAGKALSEKLKKKRANKLNPGGGEKSTGSTDGSSNSGGANKKGASTSDPGGRKTALKVAASADNQTGTSALVTKSAKKSEKEALGADGSATINGVAGWYCCDGGCDKATVGAVFAKALQDAGTTMVQYPEPLTATLIDGSTGPTVTAYIVADVVLTTKCGDCLLYTSPSPRD